MKWSKNLYQSESVTEKSDTFIKNLKRKKWTPGVYLIVLSQNENNLLDIYESTQFLQPALKKTKNVIVVGVAAGRTDALELVRQIIEDVYTKTGTFDVKTFFG